MGELRLVVDIQPKSLAADLAHDESKLARCRDPGSRGAASGPRDLQMMQASSSANYVTNYGERAERAQRSHAPAEGGERCDH